MPKPFVPQFQGHLADLSGAELGEAVVTYERLQEKIGRITSYASLVHAGDLSNPEIGRFYQTMQERTNAVSTVLLFFTLELNRIEDAELAAKLKDPALAPNTRPGCATSGSSVRTSSPTSWRRLLHEKYVVGRAAWSRLFDETIARLRYPFAARC